MKPRFHDRRARFENSPAWAGNGFRNRRETAVLETPGAGVMARFLFERAEREPPAPLPSVPVPQSVLGGSAYDGLRVTWLGHSTSLVEINGLRVLLDPVWSERASPVSFSGPKRFQPIPVALEAIALPDVVIVSHDHYDHLDQQTVLALAARGAKIVTALGVGARMEAWGIDPAQIIELDWWEHSEVVPGLTIRAMPSQHFSGRGAFDRNKTLWAAWSLESGAHRLFFGGDGGFDPEAFEEIGRRAGPFDLTMLEIGAFDPAWGTIHLGPEKAIVANKLLTGRVLLPVHWGTFNLGLHAWDAPAEELLVAARGTGTVLALPKIGESVTAGSRMPDEPWWRAIRAGASRARSPEARVASAP